MGWSKSYMSLSSEVKKFTLLGVVNNIGTGLASPIVLLYVHNVLGISLSLANLAVSVTAIAAMISHFCAGRLTRKVDPLLICILANLISALASVIYSLSSNFNVVIIAALLTGIGLSSSTGWFSVLGNVARNDEREFAFGVNQLSVNIGYSVGLLVCSIVSTGGSSFAYQCLFLGKALSHLLLSLGLILLFKSFSTNGRQKVDLDNKTVNQHSIQLRMVLLAVIYFGLIFSGIAQLDSAVPSGVIDQNTQRFGWSVASLMLIDSIGTIVFNVLISDKLSKLSPACLIILTCSVWCLSWISFAVGLSNPSELSSILLPIGIALFAFGEIPFAMTMPALTYRLLPKEKSGEAFGYQNVGSSLGFIVAPLVTSLFLSYSGTSMAFILYAVILLGICFASLIVIKRL